jgi:N,N'-diacetyllegionaminate synthase
VSSLKKTIVIAEAGVNHNGDVLIAMDLIDVAANAGADFVKFQTFKADQLVTKAAKKAEYQVTDLQNLENQYEMLSKLELSIENHIQLINHCKKKNIGFLSTAFDLTSLDFLNRLELPIFKIPSGEITNFPYLAKVGGFGKNVILSTGMSNLSEIGDAISVLESNGVRRNQITVLHCSSAYPTPYEEVNLKAMITIEKEFDVKIGYSDHTLGIEIPIAAVALGATVVEKHFTLDREFSGPDHKASLEPDELARMIIGIRNVETALGDGEKRVQDSEMKNIDVIRKSIVAAQTIKKGEFFTSTNITTKRPGHGISPMKWQQVIGTVAKRNYEEDDAIE